MKTTFSECYESVTKQEEGGYCDKIGDRGGETYRGIARNFEPNWKGWVLIDQIKQNGISIPYNWTDGARLDELAEEFLEEKYWIKPKIAFFDEILRLQIFDSYVNSGANTWGILRNAAGLNYWDKTVTDDLHNFHPSPKDFCEARKEYYIYISTPTQEFPQREKNKQFLSGWLLRAERVLQMSISS